MRNPLVSVIVPTYNSCETISVTLQSVLGQTLEDWECIVVDDCSIDNTVSVVKSFMGDRRLRFFSLPTNSGVAVARNKGIKESKGRFIAFLDSDDEWYPAKLERHIEFMLTTKSFFSFTSYEVVRQLRGKTERIIKAPRVLTYKKELCFNHICTSTVIYDSHVIGKVFMPNMRKRQDYATWLYILRNFGKGYGLREVLTRYYKQPNSLSSNKADLVKYNWELYRKHEKLNVPLSLLCLAGDILSKVLRVK
ncbi:MAG: teichuronic acid biosynthesis glycosyltransferase TuaG [Thermosediminibacterales bacterium]|jgi:glycosyltransferase involved in cell wall biosynthesis|nr:teichuronic acid biosynthesis glycosyltransferase TuaG [Thermosediminibacterales bacterium]HAE61860.1 glycosyl transferase [Eubacteriaceae bacterium]